MEHLSYFKLVLTDFMVQHHPDKIEDTEFINARSGLAEDEFERCSHMGMNVNEAKREALIVLYKDLKFSAYDLVKEIVEEEFDINDYEKHEFIMQMMEYTKEEFKKFPDIDDEFQDSVNYMKLYYLITGSIKLYLEKYGLQ